MSKQTVESPQLDSQVKVMNKEQIDAIVATMTPTMQRQYKSFIKNLTYNEIAKELGQKKTSAMALATTFRSKYKLPTFVKVMSNSKIPEVVAEEVPKAKRAYKRKSQVAVVPSRVKPTIIGKEAIPVQFFTVMLGDKNIHIANDIKDVYISNGIIKIG